MADVVDQRLLQRPNDGARNDPGLPLGVQPQGSLHLGDQSAGRCSGPGWEAGPSARLREPEWHGLGLRRCRQRSRQRAVRLLLGFSSSVPSYSSHLRKVDSTTKSLIPAPVPEPSRWWGKICGVHRYAELLRPRSGNRPHARLWTVHNGASLGLEAWPAVCRAAGSDRAVGSVEPRTLRPPISPWDRL